MPVDTPECIFNKMYGDKRGRIAEVDPCEFYFVAFPFSSLSFHETTMLLFNMSVSDSCWEVDPYPTVYKLFVVLPVTHFFGFFFALM